jgi:hypothetical protein
VTSSHILSNSLVANHLIIWRYTICMTASLNRKEVRSEALGSGRYVNIDNNSKCSKNKMDAQTCELER